MARRWHDEDDVDLKTKRNPGLFGVVRRPNPRELMEEWLEERDSGRNRPRPSRNTQSWEPPFGQLHPLSPQDPREES